MSSRQNGIIKDLLIKSGTIPKMLPRRWYPPLVPLLFWFLFILWILYLILGKDPEIKTKLKIIVLIAYFVPMIPLIWVAFDALTQEWGSPSTALEWFALALDCLLLNGLLWPVIWANNYFRYPSFDRREWRDRRMYPDGLEPRPAWL